MVYQHSSVSLTTAELLSNDFDPQGQALTVVAVSEPFVDGTLTGSLAAGFIYTPSDKPELVNTDHRLDYLVVDTDGHVTASFVLVRILAAGDPNHPPVARDDVTRTDAGVTVESSVLVNDFDPDGGGIAGRWARGSRSSSTGASRFPTASQMTRRSPTSSTDNPSRHPRPHVQRTPHGARKRRRQPAPCRPVGELCRARRGHHPHHIVGGRS